MIVHQLLNHGLGGLFRISVLHAREVGEGAVALWGQFAQGADALGDEVQRTVDHRLGRALLAVVHNAVDELGKLINRYPYDRVFFVTNDFLKGQYWQEISEMFERNGIKYDITTIPDGEDHKNFANLENLCNTLVKKGISKGSIIIGMGGGCITNVIGLAAGMIFRGIRYIEMPTTLMGLTDSTLSNKQAINGAQGKNQFGMYYAPIALFGDTRYMYSEPLQSKKLAIVEGIKNGFISEPHLLDYFDKKLDEKVENYSEADFNELAYKIIQSKIKILATDPSEKIYGMTLEYGHTFGHAIEFLSKCKIQHGLAVAKGMCIAAELSHTLGHISQSMVDLHYHLLRDKLGMDVSVPDYITANDIMSTIRGDNKKTEMGIKYVLLKEFGACLNPDGDYQVFVEPDVVRKVLADYIRKNPARNQP
jgi:3-dehydroquinate synthetase